jgi:hypothetical protein
MGNEKKIYHGDPIREAGSLVITDFGDDLPEILENLGFKTEVICTHKFYEPYEITNADDSYAEFRSKIDRMDEYFKYNSVVFISAIKDLQMNKSQKEAERMHSLLQAQYLDAVSITGFDANEDLEVPDGCYGIEGDKGNRFTWASKEVSINLRHKADKAILAIDGYVSMDMYYRKGLGKLKLSVYAGDDIMLLIEKEYVESTGVEIRISLAEYLSAAGTQGYIPITICASDSVCPKEEGTGEDARNLSWILNRVYWQYADR